MPIDDLHGQRVKLVIEALNQLDDDKRAQAKYELLCKIMEGEGGNYSANIWATLMCDFAIACMNIGFKPREVLSNLRRHAQQMVDDKLREQNILEKAPKGGQPN